MLVMEQLKERLIPTTTHFDAARYVAAQYAGCSKAQYESLITSVCGVEVHTNHTKEAELLFGYLVVESVKQHHEGFVVKGNEIIEVAKQKTNQFLINNPWIAVQGETTTTTTTEDGVVVQHTSSKKKGGASKKELCIALFNEDGNNTKTRKELIAVFVEKLGLTPAGASTYVHNCQKGLWK